jgi:hypothetical protein
MSVQFGGKPVQHVNIIGTNLPNILALVTQSVAGKVT